MLYLADQLGLSITPIDVTWDDIAGSSVRVGRDSLQMIRDLRSFSHTKYENPVIELPRLVDVTAIDQVARQFRVQGLVVARGALDSLLVLPRDGALGGLSIATELGGTFRTAGLAELSGRTFDAVVS